MPTPALPNACGDGLKAAKASVLNQRSIVRCDAGSSGIADQVRPRAPFAAEVEHRRPAECGGQRQPALHDVNAGQLPAAQHEVGRLVPVVAEAASAAERQLPDVAGDEAVRDVELGRAALGAEVVSRPAARGTCPCRRRRRRRWSRCDPARRSAPCPTCN